MADTMTAQPLSPSRKRNHEGEIINPVMLVDSTDNVSTNTDTTATRPRQSSEAPSTASSLTELTSINMNSPVPSKSINLAVDGHDSSKKRKLTFAEREVEKAVRKREKEEAMARKEEEKRLRYEERRKKEEEREATRRAREIEKAEKKKVEDAKKQEKEEKRKAKEQEKESERLMKEAEKLKKERSQMRIASFFGKPQAVSTPPSTPDDQSVRSLSRRSSIASVDVLDQTIQTTATKIANPEFEEYILPFFVSDNTEVAPTNRWQTMQRASLFDDQQLCHKTTTGQSDIEPLSSRFKNNRTRMPSSVPVKTIIEAMQGSSDGTSTPPGMANQLDSIPYKLLAFREDIRPAYVGTYTKFISPRSARKMARNSTYKGRPDTNYDYDSEAEWEPPAEDDEEILDDEMSDDEEGDGEMEDFLDDDNDIGRRRMFVGDMDPISSGLCWQGQSFDANGFNMEDYRMDVLHESTRFPIDPFSSVHWTEPTKSSPTKIKKEESEIVMPPPRIPLAPVNGANNVYNIMSPFRIKQEVPNGENASPDIKQKGRPTDPNKVLKMVQPEYLDAFKQAIDGSDLTKAGLIEILKKQFPKCSKDAIKDTLGVVAIRVGKKEAEKKWALKV